jgi:hypothetical protein
VTFSFYVTRGHAGNFLSISMYVAINAINVQLMLIYVVNRLINLGGQRFIFAGTVSKCRITRKPGMLSCD